MHNEAMPVMTRRAKRPRLAEDGLPAEMFQDVKRACHRWLMAGKGNECEAYRMHQRMIEWLNEKRNFGGGSKGSERNRSSVVN